MGLESVTDKNPEDANGETPLHYAAQRGHVEVYRLIMNYVQDKNPASPQGGFTPLHSAASGGHLGVCRLIMNSVKDKSPKTFGDEMTPLHFAAIQGHLETCRFIISQVQDKNPRDKNGNTPLHSAAGGLFSTSLEICRLILENIEE